jgi:hypothetical protein
LAQGFLIKDQLYTRFFSPQGIVWGGGGGRGEVHWGTFVAGFQIPEVELEVQEQAFSKN